MMLCVKCLFTFQVPPLEDDYRWRRPAWPNNNSKVPPRRLPDNNRFFLIIIIINNNNNNNNNAGEELKTTLVLGWLEKAVSEAEASPRPLQSIRMGNPDLGHSLTEFTDRQPAFGALNLELLRLCPR